MSLFRLIDKHIVCLCRDRNCQFSLTRFSFDKQRKAEDMVTHAKKNHICPLQFLKINFPLADKWKIEHMKENKGDLNVYNDWALTTACTLF